MFDLKKLKRLKGFSTRIVNTNAITTKEFVKHLRNELNLSQSLFAEILGISVKTVEKWEQGVHPVKGASSRLLYLLSKNKQLINELYIIDGSLTENLVNNDNKNVDTKVIYYSFFNNCFDGNTEGFKELIQEPHKNNKDINKLCDDTVVVAFGKKEFSLSA